jgi:hypothetical protein
LHTLPPSIIKEVKPMETAQRLLPTAEEIESAKLSIRHALDNLPDGLSMSDVSRETGRENLDNLIQANAISVFRSNGTGLSEPRLAIVESALRRLGVSFTPPISPT